MKIRALNDDEKRYLRKALDLLEVTQDKWAAQALKEMLDNLLCIESKEEVNG